MAIIATMSVTAVAHTEKGADGYLAPEAFDILSVLPPAPRPGDARAKADRTIFKTTRSLVGTTRWAMAINDVNLAPADMLRDFSCAANISLTPDTAPRTLAFIRRAAIDTARNSAVAKQYYKRSRPYLLDKGAICQPADELAGSYDYPSGHTTAGWTWAALLAELAPDRATVLLARGRAFGESRIVCGVHNASAVEAGRLSASATLAAMRAVPAFQADQAAARAELEGLRRDPNTAKPEASQCAAEAALVAQPVE